MAIDVAATIAGLDRLATLVDAATRDIAEKGVGIVKEIAARNAPRGVEGNSTNPSGDLARSILTSPVVGDHGIYSASVGPHMIYSKQREFGGDIYGNMAFHWGKHPMGYWGTIQVLPDGRVFVKHVYQHPEPYMTPAEAESLVPIEAMALETVATALEAI
jgi:hypothetical protein